MQEISQDLIRMLEKRHDATYIGTSVKHNLKFQSNRNGNRIIICSPNGKLLNNGNAKKAEAKRTRVEQQLAKKENILDMLKQYYPSCCFAYQSHTDRRLIVRDKNGRIWEFSMYLAEKRSIINPVRKPKGVKSLKELQKEEIDRVKKEVCRIINEDARCSNCRTADEDSFQLKITRKVWKYEQISVSVVYDVKKKIPKFEDIPKSCHGVYMFSKEDVDFCANEIANEAYKNGTVTDLRIIEEVLEIAKEVCRKQGSTFVLSLKNNYDALFHGNFPDIPAINTKNITCTLKDSNVLVVNHLLFSFRITMDTMRYQPHTFTAKSNMVHLDKGMTGADVKKYCGLILETMKKAEVTATYKSGKGLLFGLTTIVLSLPENHDVRKAVMITPPPLSADFEKWKADFLQVFRDKVKPEILELKKVAKKMKEMAQKIVNSPLRVDIIRVVQENESYITENAIVQALRRTKIALNAPIFIPEGVAKYNLLSVDDISHEINLLIKDRVLTEKEVKGTYGRFTILKLDHTISAYLETCKPNIPSISTVRTAADQDNAKMDYQSLSVLLSYVTKYHKTPQAMMRGKWFLRSSLFLALRYDELLALFVEFHEDVLAYFQMLIDLDDGKYPKSAAKLVRQAIREQKRKAKEEKGKRKGKGKGKGKENDGVNSSRF